MPVLPPKTTWNRELEPTGRQGPVSQGPRRRPGRARVGETFFFNLFLPLKGPTNRLRPSWKIPAKKNCPKSFRRDKPVCTRATIIDKVRTVCWPQCSAQCCNGRLKMGSRPNLRLDTARPIFNSRCQLTHLAPIIRRPPRRQINGVNKCFGSLGGLVLHGNRQVIPTQAFQDRSAHSNPLAMSLTVIYAPGMETMSWHCPWMTASTST